MNVFETRNVFKCQNLNFPRVFDSLFASFCTYTDLSIFAAARLYKLKPHLFDLLFIYCGCCSQSQTSYCNTSLAVRVATGIGRGWHV